LPLVPVVGMVRDWEVGDVKLSVRPDALAE
jgi:hypothetical protein